MKKKEIIKITLKAYNTAIKKIEVNKTNYRKCREYLRTNELQYGVCNFLIEKKVIKTTPNWIGKHTKTNSYGETSFPAFWGRTPYKSKTRKEIIESLKLRKDILSKELKTCK